MPYLCPEENIRQEMCFVCEQNMFSFAVFEIILWQYCQSCILTVQGNVKMVKFYNRILMFIFAMTDRKFFDSSVETAFYVSGGAF